jgi:hypothetical protein
VPGRDRRSRAIRSECAPSPRRGSCRLPDLARLAGRSASSGAGRSSGWGTPPRRRSAPPNEGFRQRCDDAAVTQAAGREDLYVPDRFEGLRDAGTGALRHIVTPVEDALEIVTERFAEIQVARQGGLLLLRGETGAGKSTFLDTVGLFRQGLSTQKISPGADVPAALNELDVPDAPNIVVLDGREALGDVSAAEIESAMHAINAFVRSPRGRKSLVVWPTNKDDLTDLLSDFGLRLGGEALLGTDGPVSRFTGPPRQEYVRIAERTVAALNESASLAALGVSDEKAAELAATAETIGQYLGRLRNALVQNSKRVRRLMPTEQYRVWVLVVAGTDSEGDVAALTRGRYSYTDIDRAMTATGANIVEDLKKNPDELGILGSILDSKILHMEMMTILAVARNYGDAALHKLMRSAGMAVGRDRQAASRLEGSEIGLILSGSSLGTRKRGKKPGGSTLAAFNNLARIARTNDGALNRAIGEGLKSVGLIDSYETERVLGTKLNYFSDLYCVQRGAPIRIEVMWRAETSRAEIANYALKKLGNYGKAIGLLQ